MITIGITGGVGMGKSTLARMFVKHGIPVFNADAWVHRSLNARGSAVQAVAAAFPEAYDRGQEKIDRRCLGALVFGRPRARKKLEQIIHPLVRAAEIRFIARHQKKQTPMVVLDIPLLFETGADALCAAVICVTAPPALQRARVLRRPGMTPEKFKAILAAQMNDRIRRKKADYVLKTDQGQDRTWRDLQTILKRIKQTYARNRPRHRNHGV